MCNVYQYPAGSEVLCNAAKAHKNCTQNKWLGIFSPYKIGSLHLDRFYVAGLLAQWHKQLGWVNQITEIILSYALDNAQGFADWWLHKAEYSWKWFKLNAHTYEYKKTLSVFSLVYGKIYFFLVWFGSENVLKI